MLRNFSFSETQPPDSCWLVVFLEITKNGTYASMDFQKCTDDTPKRALPEMTNHVIICNVSAPKKSYFPTGTHADQSMFSAYIFNAAAHRKRISKTFCFLKYSKQWWNSVDMPSSTPSDPSGKGAQWKTLTATTKTKRSQN